MKLAKEPFSSGPPRVSSRLPRLRPPTCLCARRLRSITVRVCSAYGTGFFYIPGTDTCLRVGGSVRMDINTSELNQRGGLVTRGQNSYTTNGRARLFLDSRTGTDFGMLRAYIGVEHTIPGSNGGANATRIPQAYIQWGGLTAGRISSSAFEYYTSATYRGSYRSSSSTYYDGANALWYTFDFGQGFSATLALEGQQHPSGCKH